MKRLLTALALIIYLITAPAIAADPAPAPEKPSAAEIDRVINLLESDSERKDLVDELKSLKQGVAATQTDEPSKFAPVKTGFYDFIRGGLMQVSTTLSALWATVPPLDEVYDNSLKVFDGFNHETLLNAALMILAVFGAALILEKAAAYILRAPLRRLQKYQDHLSISAVLTLIIDLIITAIPYIIFLVVGGFAAGLLIKDQKIGDLVSVALMAGAIARGASAIIRSFLGIDKTPYFLTPKGHKDSSYLFVWIKRFINVGVYGWLVTAIASILSPQSALAYFFKVIVGLLLVAMAIGLILQNRLKLIDGWVKSLKKKSSPLAAVSIFLLRLWHIPAIVYVLALYLVFVFNQKILGYTIVKGTLLTLAIIGVSMLIIALLSRLIERLFAVGKDLNRRFPGLQSRTNRYMTVTVGIINTIIFGLAALLIFQVWGISSFEVLASPALLPLWKSLFIIALTIALSVLAWELLSAFIERKLLSYGEVSSNSRSKTVIPLIKKIVSIILFVIVGLVVLSEVGINIGPLLAGAGVVGIAIGFGAQNLVKDLLTGVSLIMEDAIRVGDNIEVDGRAGLVEKLTIGRVVLRDAFGSQHIIPFSNVSSIKNMSRDFSYYVLDVNISYKESVDDVMTVLEDIGKDMQKDKAFAKDMLEPIEVAGLDRFTDAGPVIRVRIKTKPSKQGPVGNEFNRLMKIKFDQLGIQFPQRTVQMISASQDTLQESKPRKPKK